MFWKKKTDIYHLFESPVSGEMLGVWHKHLGIYQEVVGYSATGALFLYAPDSNQYLIFYPAKYDNNSSSYGAFDSLSEFEEKVLKEQTFHEYGLYPIGKNDLKQLQRTIGSLEKEEIYYPKLDPAIGGSIELDKFVKGDLWVRTDILGQNRGIE